MRLSLIAFLSCLLSLSLPTFMVADEKPAVFAHDLSAAETPAQTPSAEAPEEEAFNFKELLMEHLQDSYWWHITDVGDKHYTVFLPVIVRSPEQGWSCFSSRRLYHGATYRGYALAPHGSHEGKVVYTAPDGSLQRPLDLSFTKNVLGLWCSGAVLLALILGTAAWYRKPRTRAPRGFVGLMEMFIMSVYDDLIKPCVGPDYKKFAPLLLTFFFFIFVNNVLGLVPLFPFGANLTGNIAVTCVLALVTFFTVNLFGSRHYWRELLWPEVPVFLKCPVPLLQVIEIFGAITKPFSLMVRLFVNIFAGHAVVLALVSLVFLTVSAGVAVNSSMSVVSVLFSVFMLCLELLVAYIQAYVFTMLSAVFIGMARDKGEAHMGEAGTAARTSANKEGKSH